MALNPRDEAPLNKFAEAILRDWDTLYLDIMLCGDCFVDRWGNRVAPCDVHGDAKSRVFSVRKLIQKETP